MLLFSSDYFKFFYCYSSVSHPDYHKTIEAECFEIDLDGNYEYFDWQENKNSESLATGDKGFMDVYYKGKCIKDSCKKYLEKLIKYVLHYNGVFKEQVILTFVHIKIYDKENNVIKELDGNRLSHNYFIRIKNLMKILNFNIKYNDDIYRRVYISEDGSLIFKIPLENKTSKE